MSNITISFILIFIILCVIVLNSTTKEPLDDDGQLDDDDDGPLDDDDDDEILDDDDELLDDEEEEEEEAINNVVSVSIEGDTVNNDNTSTVNNDKEQTVKPVNSQQQVIQSIVTPKSRYNAPPPVNYLCTENIYKSPLNYDPQIGMKYMMN